MRFCFWLPVFFIFVCVSSQRVKHNAFFDSFQKLGLSASNFLPRGNVSYQCEKQSVLVEEEAAKLSLWALQIFDASAKIPSGLLSGNLNQLGDFDLCLSSHGMVDNESIKGQYCLADISFTLNDPKLHELDERIHAYRHLTSELKDPSQRLPKLSSWKWGICLPATCSASELFQHLNDSLSAILSDFGTAELSVNPDACYTTNKLELSFGHFVTIIVFTTLAVAVFIGTISPENSPKKLLKILKCFSLRRNWEKLVKVDNDSEDIAIVHGARFLNATALLLSHKQMALMFNPFVNATKIGETMNGTWSMIGRSAILYTDSFIFISGLLTSYSMIKELDRKGKINIGRNLMNRFIRFTPNLLFLILTCTYIIEFLGNGPLWGYVVSKYSQLCRVNMWRNFMYIHNYFGFEDMCLTHTHQVGIDMQLYLFSPILVYVLWKNPKRGFVTMAAIGVISTWLRYSVALDRELSPVIYYGVSVDRLLKTAKYSYILPTHRATVYVMGLLLGYVARREVNKLKISSFFSFVGWSTAVAFAVVAIFGSSHMALKGYVYNSHDAAYYNAYAPILWCLFLTWCCIAGWNNCGGWFYSMLTWKYFQIFSKISYAVYLVQFPVFFYNVGKNRTSQYYNGFISIFDLEEFILIFIISVFLTVSVDLPFQNLKRELTVSQQLAAKTEQSKRTESPRILNHG